MKFRDLFICWVTACKIFKTKMQSKSGFVWNKSTINNDWAISARHTCLDPYQQNFVYILNIKSETARYNVECACCLTLT